MSEWQPIETAPKDGTVIDLWAVDRCANCFWYEQEDPEDWRYSEWRQLYSEAPHSSFPLGLEPTHWMPLPEPPTP